MITLVMKNGPKKAFNLRNFEREKALRDAWYSMSSIDSCADKKLKITTDNHEIIIARIDEIEKILFEESVYVMIKKEDVKTRGRRL